jgi:hypothetical protein
MREGSATTTSVTASPSTSRPSSSRRPGRHLLARRAIVDEPDQPEVRPALGDRLGDRLTAPAGPDDQDRPRRDQPAEQQRQRDPPERDPDRQRGDEQQHHRPRGEERRRKVGGQEVGDRGRERGLPGHQRARRRLGDPARGVGVERRRQQRPVGEQRRAPGPGAVGEHERAGPGRQRRHADRQRGQEREHVPDRRGDAPLGRAQVDAPVDGRRQRPAPPARAASLDLLHLVSSPPASSHGQLALV